MACPITAGHAAIAEVDGRRRIRHAECDAISAFSVPRRFAAAPRARYFRRTPRRAAFPTRPLP